MVVTLAISACSSPDQFPNLRLRAMTDWWWMDDVVQLNRVPRLYGDLTFRNNTERVLFFDPETMLQVWTVRAPLGELTGDIEPEISLPATPQQVSPGGTIRVVFELRVGNLVDGANRVALRLYEEQLFGTMSPRQLTLLEQRLAAKPD
jgi:hypothetical protein